MLELAKAPHYQEKLRQDIIKTTEKLTKEKGANFPLEFTDIFKYQYLTLVVNEALRLWPVVALGTTVIFRLFIFSFLLSFFLAPTFFPPSFFTFQRILAKDTVIGGYPVKKGTSLRFPHYLVHRDPDLWDRPVGFLFFLLFSSCLLFFASTFLMDLFLERISS